MCQCLWSWTQMVTLHGSDNYESCTFITNVLSSFSLSVFLMIFSHITYCIYIYIILHITSSFNQSLTSLPNFIDLQHFINLVIFLRWSLNCFWKTLSKLEELTKIYSKISVQLLRFIRDSSGKITWKLSWSSVFIIFYLFPQGGSKSKQIQISPEAELHSTTNTASSKKSTHTRTHINS